MSTPALRFARLHPRLATWLAVAGLLVAAASAVFGQSVGATITGGFPTWMEPTVNPGASNATGMLLDGATEMLAHKFLARSTSPVTHVNCNFTVVGSPTLIVQVESDSSDAPNGTPLGTASADTLVNTSGFTGAVALGTNTGNLTLNNYYWAVWKDGATGNDPTASTHSVQYRSTGFLYFGQKMRHHNGTNWTTTSQQQFEPNCVVTHANGVLSGFGVTAAQASSAQTNIFGTNRQAVAWTSGVTTTWQGCQFRVTKTGTPGNLQCVLYEGTTEKASCTKTASDIATGVWDLCVFTTPASVAADALSCLVLRQASNGGDGSNHYDMRTLTIQNGLIASVMPTGMRMRAGTGDDCTAWSDVPTEAPLVRPFAYDPTTAFDGDPGGGGTTSRGGLVIQ